jgi:hypothetical protein
MTRKEREKFFEKIRADAERFCPDPATLSKPEISEMLAACGTNLDRLRAKIHESAKHIVITQKQKGEKVPKYLRELIERTANPAYGHEEHAKATESALQWLGGFVAQAFTAPSQLTVQRAYRKRDELSRSDADLLDILEEKLKNSIEKINE